MTTATYLKLRAVVRNKENNVTPRMFELIREYREKVINRRSFVYLWAKEQAKLKGAA